MLRFDVKKSGIPGLKTVNPVYPVTGEYLLIAKSRHALMEGLSAESGKVFRAIRAFNRAIHEREAEERGDYDLEPASAEQAAAEQQQLFDGYVYLQMWEHSQGPVNAAAHAARLAPFGGLAAFLGGPSDRRWVVRIVTSTKSGGGRLLLTFGGERRKPEVSAGRILRSVRTALSQTDQPNGLSDLVSGVSDIANAALRILG